MRTDLGPITVIRKSGTERFHHNGQPLDFDVLSFWQWSDTDLLRQADVYDFCLLDHKDLATIDLLDLAQWTFFVVSTGQKA